MWGTKGFKLIFEPSTEQMRNKGILNQFGTRNKAKIETSKKQR